MAKDGDKKNQDLAKEEMRSGTWTPVPYLRSVEHIFSLQVLVGELTARFPLCCVFRKLPSAPKDVSVFIKM